MMVTMDDICVFERNASNPRYLERLADLAMQKIDSGRINCEQREESYRLFVAFAHLLIERGDDVLELIKGI